ncbi:MAG: GNAT family protein [Gammaproteobacteria bacterium]|nr:GNAT family protein [Gammaproteobacteria bacterium]
MMKKTIPNFPMPITTPRLLIRPPEINDVKIFNGAIIKSFEELRQFMDWSFEKQTLKQSEDYIKSAIQNWIEKKNDEPYLPLFIFDRKTNEFVGAGGFHHYNWATPSIETGYWIRTSRSGQGLMTEAINAHTQYAFKQLKVNRIAITCHPDNVKSKNIPERLNYSLEGRLKNHRRKPITNELGDTLIYAKYDCENLPQLLVAWGNP